MVSILGAFAATLIASFFSSTLRENKLFEVH